MKNLEIFCVTNKTLDFLSNENYKIAWVGQQTAPENYILCNSGDNIFFKEKNYSELTFHYWYWKNRLDPSNKNWIGFCQRRRFWVKKDSEKKNIDQNNLNQHILDYIPDEFSKYNAIICNPIFVNNVKKMKLIKRGMKSIIKDPRIFFDKERQSLLLHFDMHHGHGNIEKAINHLHEKDRSEFYEFLKTSTFYNPHIMFISKPNIANLWFTDLFSWLFKCEESFGFKNLKGYDTQRLYAYLAERYLSFWFKKYSNYLEWPWSFIDLKD